MRVILSSFCVLIDRFGRTVDYLRVSVTDRCNFRCTYCMAEKMQFLPRARVLSLEELYTCIRAFVSLGVRKVRITGGEPLVRRNVGTLLSRLGRLPELETLAITTNGSLLAKQAMFLRDAGVNRLNISIDSLDNNTFARLTRFGKLDSVIAGIDAALAAGFSAIRLNAVILRGINDGEILNLVNFAREREIDIAFIEEMPLGDIGERSRAQSYFSSDAILNRIKSVYPLDAAEYNSAGPARYFSMRDSTTRVGVISPHSKNFCASCNRVRLTVEGRLLLCLGNEHSVDLRSLLRSDGFSHQLLQKSIANAMYLKPRRHHFNLEEKTQILRFMNTTGG